MVKVLVRSNPGSQNNLVGKCGGIGHARRSVFIFASMAAWNQIVSEGGSFGG